MSWHHPFPPHASERNVKVHHIIFLLWLIVFAGWAIKQFARYNEREEKARKRLRQPRA